MQTPFKSKVKQFITVDYNDFDQFISSHYGQEFEIVADQECGNDCDLSFDVRKGFEFTKWDDENLDKFKTSGRSHFSTNIILQDLFRQGLIPEGEYLISVSW